MSKSINIDVIEIGFWSKYIESGDQKHKNFNDLPNLLNAVIVGEQISGKLYRDIKIKTDKDEIIITIPSCEYSNKTGTECNAHIGVLLGSMRSKGIKVNRFEKRKLKRACILNFYL